MVCIIPKPLNSTISKALLPTLMLWYTLNSVHACERIFNFHIIYSWLLSVLVTNESSMFLCVVYILTQQVNIISKDQKQTCFIKFQFHLSVHGPSILCITKWSWNVVVINHTLATNHFEEEIYHTNLCLFGLYYKPILNNSPFYGHSKANEYIIQNPFLIQSWAIVTFINSWCTIAFYFHFFSSACIRMWKNVAVERYQEMWVWYYEWFGRENRQESKKAMALTGNYQWNG